MHSIHTLAHRAPPATRTRARWQPYSALSSLSTSPSSDSAYLTTPTSAASSPTPSCDHAISQTQPQQPKEKNKFALGLVDQAVKSLSDIWRPQDIPPIFLTANRITISETSQPLVSNNTRNSITPQQQPASQLFPSTEDKLSECSLTTRNLVPIRGFVHEVLRRSRTSASVLQTALCYLEAIRPKIPELATLERQGQCSMPEPELADRITPATEAKLAAEAEIDSGLGIQSSIYSSSSEDSMDTVRVSDSGSTLVSTDPIALPDCMTLKKPRSPSAPLAPLPPLPSPLLCPRRAFLASLILASKFTQDKCYSNRAWAKLSGLPPREIGRCERALGDALDWRLWVGKTPASAPVTAAGASAAPRALSKCQSEGNIRLLASEPTAFLVASQKKASSSRPLSSSAGAGLRRAATLPSEIFNSDRHNVSRNTNIMVSQWIHDGSDQAMSSPQSIVATPSVANAHQLSPSTQASGGSNSISPSTPGLSHSPTSTESSSGDRTIQMSAFLDDTNIPFSIPTSDGWSWLNDISPSHLALSAGKDWNHAVPPDSHGIQNSQINLVSEKGIQPPGSVFGLWTAEAPYCSLQA
ncbi:hypothetical protein K435DRAFT_779079 [Dendrothele bispora CBS 962.96]|uniref:Cyclin N-terminal domain-containing protein n=1 Tax=Dendrothele bispora (strain CBS 962.96) TaxID=1314807 RepID=A0A4S8M1E8_DENBC|nr:hypothetical protein K435DRAFT_779079 [Dendrothele bispora CBS 962.96]